KEHTTSTSSKKKNVKRDVILLQCEVCSTHFETRRGLSSHARSHLRQLGVGGSESSGAPIDLLHQITKERGITTLSRPPVTSPKKPPRSSPSPTLGLHKEEEFEEDPSEDIKPPIALSVLATTVKVTPSPSTPSLKASPPVSPFRRSRSPSPVVRKAPISSLLPVSSLLRSNVGKTSSGSLSAHSKPFWAPQETDAPLNLTDPNKDIVCQLCGAWFETRKGLSSHARAHLRHFGVEYSESQGSPIDLLNRLIINDTLKLRTSPLPPSSPEDSASGKAPFSPSPPSSSSSSKRPLLSHSTSPLYKATVVGGGSVSKGCPSLVAPPRKKPRTSPLQVFRLTGGELAPFSQGEYFAFCIVTLTIEPLKDVGCEFCGEFFENRKGLSSHARSHLRQMGITEWSVNGSPIDTLREIITRRGLPCALPLKPKSALSSPVTGAEASAASSYTNSTTVLATGATLKPKPEPVQLEVTALGGECSRARTFTSERVQHSWASSDGIHDKEPTRDIRCEFCGEYFENRKGLSSHARSHLRQMGITEWTVNGSPIDTLREVLRKQKGASSPLPNHNSPLGVKKEPGQACNASCELCGFYFENRKALASHARAHLRQFGVTEWCVNGSPIETLSAWIRSRPHKVAEMQSSYMQGNRNKKRGSSSLSSDSDHTSHISQKASGSQWSSFGRGAGRHVTGGHWGSSRSEEGKTGSNRTTQHNHAHHSSTHHPGTTLPHAQVAHSELNVRLPRGTGMNDGPPKHQSHPDGGERESGPSKPPRTSTIPALVPKPPSTPLVKVVGKIYSLKCRFCEVEFHGPLSVQEDWIRHLQQHILNLNYTKPAETAPDGNSNAPAKPKATQASTPLL
uniref:C2H2-type domain-containing protein n=1 Tax=Denticeps clupeoides TaxID=299321 RepID=A0AAY4AWT8_9TELE